MIVDPPKTVVKAAQILAGSDGKLGRALQDMGVAVAEHSEVLFVDGARPPDSAAKPTIDAALAAGNTVFVWGADIQTLAQLNALLPERLELTRQATSSLVPWVPDPLIAGLAPVDLYFSEQDPSTILTTGLAGPLINRGTGLLVPCPTDWRLWNGQPETTKTAMALRSELELRPRGLAMSKVAVGPGRLVLCTLPPVGETSRATALNRRLLENLGLVLVGGAGDPNLLSGYGVVSKALVCGPFDGAFASQPRDAGDIAAGSVYEGRAWRVTSLDSLRDVSFISFWLYCPKSLDNLLLDPHLPTVEMTVEGGTTQTWLDGREILGRRLGLREGWNHVLLRVGGPISIKLTSNQPDFVGQLKAGLQRPE